MYYNNRVSIKKNIKGIWLSKEKLSLAIQDLNLIDINITIKTAEFNSGMGNYK